ncbi:ABC transporter permease [Chondromyces apiculatus]|uniref:ABC transporter, permease protein n=1 Tax=Chondromyces apiculatus DSM 436 TaxID=1192034 RepID=A0A017T6R7_9BACT|nr:ABC transporter permease [Chondromyces apiculatus]EYF04702.1 ABC transporter, permease protein [Chondromyces apiculatus DSM 436]
MIPVAYNLRNLAVRKTTTLATAAGLGLVVFVFASVLMLANSIERTLGRSGRPDVAIVLRKGSDAELASGIEAQQVSLILGNADVAKRPDGKPDGVGEIAAVILLPKLGTDGESNVQVRGVPDDVMAFRPSVTLVEGRPAQPGSDEVIVGKAISGRFKGLTLGQSFELRKNRPLKVVGIFADGGSSFESEVWGDVHSVGSAFGRQGSMSSVRVRLLSPAKFDGFKASIDQNQQLGLEVLRETDYYEKQSEGMNVFIGALGISIAFLFSVGAMIGAMITMYGSIANRQREIGTLRALGFSRFSILLSFLLESICLALIGGAIGALASLAMGMVRFSMVNFASFSEVVFTFEPTPGIMLGSLAVAVVMGLFGGFLPAVQAARMSPIKAMRG